MDSGQKPRKRDLLASLFKRRLQTSQTVSQTASVEVAESSAQPNNTVSGDRQRTKTRYLEAVKLLEEAVQGCGSSWGSFEFPELKGEPGGLNDAQFREKINMALEARQNEVKDQSMWEKCSHVIECAFTAFSPFAKNFLTIAKEGQAIADKEIGRKEELERTLEYISQQFAQLETVNFLPDDLEQREFVINRAMDVRSASMMYLSFSIRHDTTSMGTAGKVIKTFFLGDVEIIDSKTYLDKCVENYQSALNSIVGIRMIIKVWEVVKEMATLNVQNRNDESKAPEEKFIVPYQANPRFLGRTQFLQNLKDKLNDVTSQRYNHRIALYGMGGIGKTQCALGYVYANRDVYDRIYWITAVDQTSLLSGYQDIAKRAKVPCLENVTPLEIAQTVLSWLRREHNWLVVIDNLDDIRIADNLLPENGSKKHTLITTRNPNTMGIPAEPFEVPLLDADDSIELISSLSNIEILGSAEKEKAVEIVKELGYLPLAIEQAAAYIREVVSDFSSYLEEYRRNHQRLHLWISSGNRQYPNSIATTWSMSFHLLDKNAMNLLRLFSYLNPDIIIIQFLAAGAKALQDDLRLILSSQAEMASVLLELEKLSLIKWDRKNKSISIHRLVQTVTIDKMSDEESKSTLINIIDLFIQAFPEFVTNETRSLCRMYEGQVMEPLTRMKTVRTLKSAFIRTRVGVFLQKDGKYDDSKNLLIQAAEIYRSILGNEHPDTLRTMRDLAWTYLQQGRMAEAATLNEEVLQNMRRILGDEHPDTLWAMGYLAWTYAQQGRTTEAATHIEEVLQKSRRILGDEHPDTLMAMHSLALIYFNLGRMAEAAILNEEVLLKRQGILGDDHPDTLTTMNNLALTYSGQGRMGEALALNEQALEKMRHILGDGHPDTLTSMNNLALTYRDQGKTAEAAALQEQVLDKMRRILGDEHPDTLTSMNNLALTYRDHDKTAEAAALQEQVLEKRRRILGDDHPNTLTFMGNLARTYQTQGRTAEAAALQELVLEKRRRILGDEHPDTLMIMNNLALTYLGQGRMGEALALNEQALEKMRHILGDDHPDTLASMNNLALTYQAQGRTAEAAALQEQVLKKRQRILGDDHPHTLTSMGNLAQMYEAQGRTAEAAALQEGVLEKRRRIVGDDHPSSLTTMNNLACTYRDQGRTYRGGGASRAGAREDAADPGARAS